ncbi:MAG: DNA-3-methyladenine glycosylase 2 family protein [Clostridia bacterium]|nr:DNA-3-methyladenine glycosylase 2 family protein [Clostridia bacterium]
MKKYQPYAKEKDGNVLVFGVEHFGLKETFDCGQAFRWQALDDNTWVGIALGRKLRVGRNDGVITLYDCTLDEYEAKWRGYLDIDRDYGAIINIISENETLKNAAKENSGIRILKQDKWEALCSFIISQNNNIPRIMGIVERLCEHFGEPLSGGGYTFPSAEKIAALDPEDLAPVRSGFRARYIIDGARKYLNGGIDLELISTADTDTARAELMKITGVGVKVADCTLLFGFQRIDALPKDVWIKRALEEYFDGHFPECAAPYAGIAQQYLFNYIRKQNA